MGASRGRGGRPFVVVWQRVSAVATSSKGLRWKYDSKGNKSNQDTFSVGQVGNQQ
ncbi:hypothetical protein K523DRAFT_322319 [Schizophyllum commune Tattone D]|nr:hypothetical protein K523DRAFT_322319 [Schizophyllum commune Tattone D]